MGLTNSGDAAATDVTATITLPSGLRFAAPNAGASHLARLSATALEARMQYVLDGTIDVIGGTCAFDVTGQMASCDLGTLASGTSTTIDLEVGISGNLVTDAYTTFAVQSGAVAKDTYTVRTGLATVEQHLPAEYVGQGRIAVTQVGAPLMLCDTSIADCRKAVDFNGNSTTHSSLNNNSWAMIALNEAGGASNSGTTNLALPEDATVLWASLEWSANRGAADLFDRALNAGSIKAPGAPDFIPVTASSVIQSSDASGRRYYQAKADITALVKAHGNGAWSLADVALPATRLDTDPSYYAGFALTVAYSTPSLPMAHVAVFDGSEWVTSTMSPQFVFHTDGATVATVGWVAWETDRGLAGDQLFLDDEPLTPRHWNGSHSSTGDPGNAGDSTAFGSTYANTLGTDAKPFDQFPVEPGAHVLRVSTESDNFVVGSITVVVAD